ncbi:MAG: MM0924 family protein [Pyrinomonadaceae bacterium]
MEDFLKQLMGKKVDISCGTSAVVRGDIVDVKDGILYLRDDEDKVAYAVIEKIAFVWEVKSGDTRAGFLN